MAKQIWFPAKKYGWGWGIPLTPQGWMTLLGCLTIGLLPLVWEVFHIHALNATSKLLCEGAYLTADVDTCKMSSSSFAYIDHLFWLALGWLFLWIGILILISYKKGEAPRWRWGDKS